MHCSDGPFSLHYMCLRCWESLAQMLIECGNSNQSIDVSAVKTSMKDETVITVYENMQKESSSFDAVIKLRALGSLFNLVYSEPEISMPLHVF